MDFTPNSTLRKIMESYEWFVYDVQETDDGKLEITMKNNTIIKNEISIPVTIDPEGGNLNSKFAHGVQERTGKISVEGIARNLSMGRHRTSEYQAADEDDAVTVMDSLSNMGKEMVTAADRAGLKKKFVDFVSQFPGEGEWRTDGKTLITDDGDNAYAVATCLSILFDAGMEVIQDGSEFSIQIQTSGSKPEPEETGPISLI